MRALCGAIITAGALIGLGLTALGIGTRYEHMLDKHTEGTFKDYFLGAPSLATIMVVLILAVLIGLGIAFIGLAYHHERRHREWLEDAERRRPHVPA
jgi:hypothetical protein